MRRMIAAVLALALALSLCACGKKAAEEGTQSPGAGQETLTWQEQYDLGVRYLSEGNYEQAIIAFTAAIEIDPKRAEGYTGRGSAYLGQGSADEYLTAAFTDFETALSLDDTNADAYLGMAEVYIAREQFDEAIEILRQGVEKTGDQCLSDRLAELENGKISDYWGRLRKEIWYDENGDVTCWYEYDYNDQGQCVGITSYGPDGSQLQYVEQCYDEQGHMIYGCYSWSGAGTMRGAAYTYNSAGKRETIVIDSGDSLVYTYDLDGREIREDTYDESGKLTGYRTREYGDGYDRKNYYNANEELEQYTIQFYDGQGKKTRYESYGADGTLRVYITMEYDADGNYIASNFYDADGNLTRRSAYD